MASPAQSLVRAHVLHLLPSEAAAALLRDQMRDSPGRDEIVAISDLHALGPLTDERLRAEFLEAWFADIGREWYPGADLSTPFAAWDGVRKRVAVEVPDAVAIWATDSSEDRSFFGMACRQLAGIRVPTLWVRVAAALGHAQMAWHPLGALAAHFAHAEELAVVRRERHAAEFTALAAGAGLREVDADGALRLRDTSCHDALFTACLQAEWRPALWLVGNVMGRADAFNPIAEGFCVGRLIHLIRAGQIEADRAPGDLRRMRVRRPAP